MNASTLTVSGLFAERARAQPDAPALTDGTFTLSYVELHRRVQQLAAALAQAGIGPGDRVAVWSENRFEYLELELAAARLGAIVACSTGACPTASSCTVSAWCSRRCWSCPSATPPPPPSTDGVPRTVVFGDDFERLRHDAPAAHDAPGADPEAGHGDPLHQRHHGPAQGRAGEPARDGGAPACFRPTTRSGAGGTTSPWSPLFPHGRH